MTELTRSRGAALSVPRPRVLGPRGGPFAAGIALIVLSYASLALSGHDVDLLVEEDGWFEWLGALSLFAASGLFLAAAVTTRRRHAGTRSGRVLVAVLALLALVMFVGGGEEISWGQRIFGWQTSTAMSAANAQGETNLHNLKQFHGLIDVDRLFRIGWGAMFVVIPLLAWASRSWRERFVRYIPVAPAGVALLLIVNWLATLAAGFVFNRSGAYASIYDPGHAATEIQEALTAVLIAVAAYVALAAARDRRTR